MWIAVELNQTKNGLSPLPALVQPVQRFVEHFAVEGLHALARQRAGVFDLLLADAAELRIDRSDRPRRSPRRAARRAGRTSCVYSGFFWPGIVELFRLFFGVQVVEVAEPLVEAVHGRQELVAVAQVVLAELRGGVALRLEHFGQRRIVLLDAARRAGNADGRHAGADRQLPHDERRAPGGAARLAVVIGEEHAVLGDAVDVRRAAHHAVRVGADIPHADVVAEDDDDVGLLRCCACADGARAQERRR